VRQPKGIKNERGWQLNAKYRVNASTIGIEIVATDEERGITDEQSRVLAAWLHYFMRRHGFDRDAIVADWSVAATSCPGLIWASGDDIEAWKNEWL
jgi:N-acetyl-anhydromuramyl-L-alanine amidase AmpD